MNPHVSAELLEQERERSLERFKREFLAEFTDNVVSWIAPEYLDACIVPDRRQLPRVSDGIYVAAVDPAFKQSDFALAIAHRTSAGLIVIDRIARWTGSTKAPLGFERVCREIAEILREYEINNLQGDQLAAAIIQQEFLKLNITYKEMTFNRQTRVRIFNNFKHLLQQRKIELLDQPEPLRQLRSLEESLASDGSIDVRPDYGKDDLAIVLGMCALELSQSSYIQLPSPITLGRASRPWDGRLPSRVSERGGFPVGQNCSKYPKCWEVGPCECHGID